jgi:hypothetical protein
MRLLETPENVSLADKPQIEIAAKPRSQGVPNYIR